MAQAFRIPDIGNTVFQWLQQTSLFKDSKEDKAPKIVRNYKIFPKNMSVKSPNYPSSKLKEDKNSLTSDYSSVSSLSTSTKNESSVKLLGMLKGIDTRRQERVSNTLTVGPEIQEYVQQQIQRRLDQFMNDINLNALNKDGKPSDDEGIMGVFSGRGPKGRKNKRETIHHRAVPPSAPLPVQSSNHISNESGSSPPVSLEIKPEYASSQFCTHYIKWLDSCDVNTSLSGERNENNNLLCTECSKPIPQVTLCGYSMCGKNSIVCSNCISTWIPKYSNSAPPSPVASHQAQKRLFSEYPYINPYGKVDHESTSIANIVKEVPRPHF